MDFLNQVLDRASKLLFGDYDTEYEVETETKVAPVTQPRNSPLKTETKVAPIPQPRKSILKAETGVSASRLDSKNNEDLISTNSNIKPITKTSVRSPSTYRNLKSDSDDEDSCDSDRRDFIVEDITDLHRRDFDDEDSYYFDHPAYKNTYNSKPSTLRVSEERVRITDELNALCSTYSRKYGDSQIYMNVNSKYL